MAKFGDYRVEEELDSDGNPFNYRLAWKFFFWWMPCFGSGYETKEEAIEVCKRLNSTKRPLST